MQRNAVTAPRCIAIIASVVAVALFFLPYITITDQYGGYIDLLDSAGAFAGVNVQASDMKNISLLTYAKLFILTAQESPERLSSYYVLAGLTFSVGAFALLAAINALCKKPVLLLLTSMLMGVMFYVVSARITDVWRASNNVFERGISCYLYYPVAVLMIISAIWMSAAKRKQRSFSHLAFA